jgi:hypothetical protein
VATSALPLLWLVTGLLSACTPQDKPVVVSAAPQDTTVPAPTKPESVTVLKPSAWDASAGVALYLPGADGGAQVVVPGVLDDSVPPPSKAGLPAGAAPATINLFGRGGLLGTVALGEFSPSTQPEVAGGCDAWPVVPIRSQDAAEGPIPRWRIALTRGAATAVSVDSLDGLPKGDAARLVVDINRAAAMRLDDSTNALRGVPFEVTAAYRVRFKNTGDVLVAIVERRMNMEASPKVERTTMILEPAPQSKGYRVAWRESQYVSEDDLISVELLAAVVLGGSRRPSLFLSLDFGDGTTLELLQRNDAGVWQLRWASAYTGC